MSDEMDSDRIYQDELQRFGGTRRPPADSKVLALVRQGFRNGDAVVVVGEAIGWRGVMVESVYFQAPRRPGVKYLKPDPAL